MLQTETIFFSSQDTSLESLPDVAPVDVSAINDIFTLSFEESFSFDTVLASADVDFDFSTGLQLNLNDSSLGNVQVDYPVLLDIALPDEITEGQSFGISFDSDSLQVVDETLSAGTGVNPAKVTGESLNFDGLSIDLFFASERSGLSNVSLFNTSFGSAFELDNNIVFDPISVEIPLVEVPAGSAEFEPVEGVTLALGTPEGSQAEQALDLASPGDLEAIDLRVIETLASVTVNPLELLSLLPTFSALDILSETFDFPAFSVAGSTVEASLETVLFAPTIAGGFGIVQDIGFTPSNLIDVEVYFEGERADLGFLSTEFDFVAPEVAGNANLADGTLDGELRFDLDGTLDLNFAIAPVGTIGVEVLSATGSITVDGEESSATIGPVFEESITGASDIGSFNVLTPVQVDLPDDFFPEVIVPFSIPINSVVPPNMQPQLLNGSGEPLVFAAPISVVEDVVSPLSFGTVQVVDPDTEGDLVVTLQVGAGTLIASETVDVAVSGSGTTRVSLRGTAESLSTYLSTGVLVQYDAPSGGETTGLSISTDDLTGNETFVLADVEIVPEELPEGATGINAANTQVATGLGEVLSGETFDADPDDDVPPRDVSDTLIGGSGNDTLIGDITGDLTDDGSDVLIGNGGNDVLTSGGGADLVIGGPGDDQLSARADVSVTLLGGPGNDRLVGGTESLITGTSVGSGASLLSGGEGNDTLIGRGTLDGGAGNDNISGYGTLRGGDGDDSLTMRGNTGIVDGGAGNDSLFGNVDGTENVTFRGGEGDDSIRSNAMMSGTLDGGPGNDSLSGNMGEFLGGNGNDNIVGQKILDGGAGDDTLSGHADSDDDFVGGDGDDLIDITHEDGSGVDTVDAGAGDDTVIADLQDGGDLDGGAGNDLLDLTESAFPALSGTLFIDFAAGEIMDEGGFSQRADGFENLLSRFNYDVEIIGSSGDDQLSATPNLSDNALRISGGSGNDILTGKSNSQIFLYGEDGDDLLRADAGNNTQIELVGGKGDDTIEADRGDGTLTGGEGRDSFSAGDGNTTVFADLDDEFFDGGFGDDLLDLTASDNSGVLFVDIFGAEQQLTIDGDGVPITGFESVIGRDGGEDILASNALADGLGGDDVILRALDARGGDGNDTYIFGPEVSDLSVDLNNVTNQLIDGGFGQVLTGFENVVTGRGDDTIVASDVANRLTGGSGDDDFLMLEGDDSVIGGEGNDFADFSGATSGLSVDLTVGQIVFEDGSRGLASGLESIIGSDGGNDNIIGTSTVSRLEGRGGNDTLTGGAQSDFIDGGAGDDDIDAGDGGNEVIGGTGNDTIRTGDGRDDVEAGDGNDDVFLGAGDDEANLGAGDDFADAGTGNDRINGGAGNDIILGAGPTGDLLDDVFSGGDGNDSLRGGEGDDMLSGDAGNDTLDAGTGFDNVEGGAGQDTFVLASNGGNDFTDFQASEDRIFIDGVSFADITVVENASGFAELRLPTGKRIFTESTIDEIRSELFLTEAPGMPSDGLNLIGTPEADVLTGGAGNDTLVGLEGDDRLIGNGGDDRIEGGDGLDTLNGGDGDDIILGGATDADRRDVIFGGAGDDNINAGHGNDQIFGQDGDDIIAGGFGVDDLQGQNGNDTINGAAFSDLVFGGAGDDFVNGGFGFDRINGGTGADKFFHAAAEGHGSDWLQDYNRAEGDVLVFGGSLTATASDFVIRTTHTATPAGERSGDDTIEEAFIRYQGETLWALVDGAGQSSIAVQVGAETFDLML